jgi:hypothetical protein
MLVSDYIDILRERLFDPAPGAGWNNTELIAYLNEAIRATCLIKSDAYVLQGYITVAAGVTQELPAAGVALFDLTENETSKRRITQVDRALLDEENRFWPNATQEVDVQHFSIDPLAPRRYYITPPNTGAGSVKALYGALPTALTATTDTVLLQDIYQPALVAYTMSRAYLKPSTRKDPAASAAAFNEWATMVGAKTKTQAETYPRVAEAKGVV